MRDVRREVKRFQHAVLTLGQLQQALLPGQQDGFIGEQVVVETQLQHTIRISSSGSCVKRLPTGSRNTATLIY